MKLAGYVRVSTEGQIDAFGKDIQREAILRWASLHGHEIVRWFEEDGVSGTTDGGNRPALSALIDEAENCGYVGMVAFDSTRLARRSVVQETLLGLVWNAGLRVFTTTADELSADDDPTRILIRQILGVIAEFDHRTTVKRLQSGRRHAMASGRFGGGVPAYGMTVVGAGKSARIVHDPVESKTVEEIVRRRNNGETFQAIADSLNRRQVPTKRGGQWLPMQVSRVFTRQQNA